MDFTRLNLKAYLTEGNSTPGSNLATAAEDKTTEAATNVSAPKQIDPARKEMQMKQRTAKFGTPKTNQTMMSNSYDPMLSLRTGKELVKMREAAKCDWRKELMEAANPDDDPNHPYVEVMPHYQYRAKEAMENLKKAQMKDKAQGNPRPALSGVNEEMLTENPAPGDYQRPEGKKPSGKFIMKGKGTDNYDRTATPKENVARRKVNKNPELRGKMGEKAVKQVETDAFSEETINEMDYQAPPQVPAQIQQEPASRQAARSAAANKFRIDPAASRSKLTGTAQSYIQGFAQNKNPNAGREAMANIKGHADNAVNVAKNKAMDTAKGLAGPGAVAAGIAAMSRKKKRKSVDKGSKESYDKIMTGEEVTFNDAFAKLVETDYEKNN